MGQQKEVENSTERNDAGTSKSDESKVLEEKDTELLVEEHSVPKQQITRPRERKILPKPEIPTIKTVEVLKDVMKSKTAPIKTVCCVCSESILLSDSLPLWADSRTLSHFGRILTKVLNLAKCEVSMLCCCLSCGKDVMTCFRLKVQIHVSTVLTNRRSGRLSLPEALDQGCHICGSVFPTVEEFTDHFILHIVQGTERTGDYFLLSPLTYGPTIPHVPPATGRRTLKRKAAEEGRAVESRRKLAPRTKDAQKSSQETGEDWGTRDKSPETTRRKPRILPKLRERLEKKYAVTEDAEEESKPEPSETTTSSDTGAGTERLRARYSSAFDMDMDEGSSVEEAPKPQKRTKKRGKKKRGTAWKERFLCHLCGLWRLKVKSQQHMEFHRKFPDAKPQKERVLPQVQRPKTKREKREKPEPISLNCPQCGVLFDRRFFLVNHLVVRHGESLSEMRRRYSKNMKREPWKCGICAKEINGIKPFRRHCDDQHAGEGFVQLRCEACPSKLFVSDILLRGHVRSVHDERRSNFDVSTYLCEICSVRCSSTTSLIRHKRLRHPNGANSDEAPQPRSFKCQYCQEMFYSAVKFRRHIISKHDPSYQCKNRKPSTSASNNSSLAGDRQPPPMPLLHRFYMGGT